LRASFAVSPCFPHAFTCSLSRNRKKWERIAGGTKEMFGETKFWLGYITVFIVVTFFVTGLLQLTEWLAKILKEPVNPIYLAAGGICAFLACLKMEDK
jgi:hypothetical protein